MPQKASFCAADYLPENFHNLDLAKSRQLFSVDYVGGTFHFLSQEDQRVEIKVMPEQPLIMQTELLPSELQPFLEIGEFRECYMTDELRIVFSNETDRPGGIALQDLAVPGVVFYVK